MMSETDERELLNKLYDEIKSLVVDARIRIRVSNNQIMLQTYWMIGKMIFEFQGDRFGSSYGNKTILELSRRMSSELGAGFSKRNLDYMRKFYFTFPNFDSVALKLGWSHYIELMKETNEKARFWYLRESSELLWNALELRREIKNGAFYRLLENKQSAAAERSLSKGAQDPSHIIKDPYYFDFLGIKPTRQTKEKEIEDALMSHLIQALLELGRGFALMDRQKRIIVDGDEFYIDLVFFNIYLNCYVIVDLKRGKLKPDALGQMLSYVGYYDTEVKTENQRPTIGLILCEDKNDTMVKYALSNTALNIFASEYRLVLPTEKELKELLRIQRSLLDNKS